MVNRAVCVLLFLFLSFNNAIGSEKCKRPRHWGIILKKGVVLKDKSVACALSIKDYILISHDDNKSREIKVGKEIGNGVHRCTLLKDKVKTWDGNIWRFIDYEKNKTKNKTSDEIIEIDHILPFDYISKNIDCDDVNEYYNFIDNLEPTTKEYNRNKSNGLCEDAIMCEKQKVTCKALAEYFLNQDLCKYIGLTIEDDDDEKFHTTPDYYNQAHN